MILDPISGKRVSVESLAQSHSANGRQGSLYHHVGEQRAKRLTGDREDKEVIPGRQYVSTVEARAPLQGWS